MLERAAGCLENAGRRFFRDSNGSIRSSSSLYSQIARQPSSPSADFPHWLLVFLQSSDQGVSHPRRSFARHSSPAVNDLHHTPPCLEFLYPQRAQQLATSLLRSPKRQVPRRRKRTVANLARTYVSDATCVYQSVRTETAPSETTGHNGGEEYRRRAKESLLGVLRAKSATRCDDAWTLYVAAGHPLDLNPALLAYMSTSDRGVDHDRANRLFSEIRVESRSAEDYLHLAKSCLAADKPVEMTRICKEAVSQDLGSSCWAFSFAYCVHNEQWALASDIWAVRPLPLQNTWLNNAPLHLDASSVSKSMFSLAAFLEDKQHDGPLCALADSLLEYAFSSLKIIEETSTQTLLSLLRKFNDLGILTAEHYFRLMYTLQSSPVRSTFIRSIVVYRNFRSQMASEEPPAKLLGFLLKSLYSFEITSGVRYLLDEFTHFYGKPTIDAYKSALIAFSRAGNATEVHEIFHKLVADHGKPLSRKLLTPLIYVHARVGNVKEALLQFSRVSDEFGLKHNTVCWNNLLTAYANADDFDGCFETFEKMLAQDVSLDAHTFGIIMAVCAKRGDVETLRSLLALAKERQVELTTPILDTVVQVYCNNGRLGLAESVAEMCLELDVKGSRVRMWNMLLWNHAFRLDFKTVARIRSRMEEARLHPDGMTYGALMLIFALVGQTDSARRLLRTLHRSRRTHATEFHYAIILYGYVKARNRDMVHVVFREMQERFGQVGLSSRLLILKSQLQRDLDLARGGSQPTDATNRLENAEKFLADSIAQMDPTLFASKEPAPGIGRQSLRQAFPVMYYEYVIAEYGVRGASDKVRDLFDQFTRGQQSLGASDNVNDVPPLRMLTTLMSAHMNADEYEKVEECWKMAFPLAVKMANRPNVDGWISAYLPSNDTATMEPPRPSLPTSAQGQQDLLVGSAPADASTVLSSFRFLLSRPLSVYLRSLAYRNEPWKIHDVVTKVEQAGFSLTTFNWSTLVQMLASSDQPSDQMEAFSIFESKFMPNFPGWKNLKRGYGRRFPDAPATIDALDRDTRRIKPSNMLGKEARKYASKIQPDFMQPTYLSMVYLASALARFRERSLYDGGAEVKALHLTAPNTIDAISDMPYLRDKFQGVLLRRRQQNSDKKSDKPAKSGFVWTGGVLGAHGSRRIRTTLEIKEGKKRHDDEEMKLPGEEDSTRDAGRLSKNESSTDTGDDPAPEAMPTPPTRTLDSQDEHDLEIETLLEAKQREAEQDGSVDVDWRQGTGETFEYQFETLVEGQPSSDSTRDATGTRIPRWKLRARESVGKKSQSKNKGH